jgi:DNA-binding NarL/FixJ family response regulator
LNPDVVLMDLRMPVMDGFEATAIIRDRHPNVKIVVLSASNLQSDIEAAMQAGAHAYLNKNRDNGDSIVRTIRSVIR